MLKLTASLIGAALLATSLPASAHSPLEAATPEDGSALQASPEAITLTFGHEVLLTSVMNMNTTGHTDLTFEPKAKAMEFKITSPALTPGENMIHWKALSADGHVMDGHLTYTVTAPAE